MECIYINLDTQLERRIRIEEEFHAHNNKGWRLQRLGAVPSSSIKQSHEFLTAEEIACFVSHTRAISAATKVDGHVMIAEDDASFCAQTFDRTDGLLQQLSRDRSWDVVFTQVGTFEATMMAFLSSTRERLSSDQTSCHDIRSLFPHVWGAASYIINAGSKQKVLDLFRNRDHTIPFDIHLMKLIYDRKLTGFLTIPFFTSLNETSVQSQLRDNTKSCQYFDYAFRKFMAIDCGSDKRSELIRDISAKYEFVKSPFLLIIGSFLSSAINQERAELVKQKPKITEYLINKEKQRSDRKFFVSEFDLVVP